MMQSGLEAGGWTVPAYGLEAAGALICGVLLAMRCAYRLGLNPEKFWNLLLATIVAALVGARMEFAATHWNDVVQVPRLLLSGSGVINWGGAAIAAIAAVIAWRRLARGGNPLPLMQVLDALALPALLVLGIMEIATAVSLWGVWNAAAVFCTLHLAVCTAAFVWMEVAKGFQLRAGELFGAVLYVVAMSMFIEAEMFVCTLGQTFIVKMGAVNNLVMVAAFLVMVAGALWVDWAVKVNPPTNEKKENPVSSPVEVESHAL